MSVDAILKEIEALTDAEQGEFLDRLAEHYPDRVVNEISRELAALLDERNAAADANPNAGYSMEEVSAYVKRKK